MRFESRTALTLMRLQQAQDVEKITLIRAEIEAIRLHLKARREEKYSPDQPRDELGKWTNAGGGEKQNADDNTLTSEEIFGTARMGQQSKLLAASQMTNSTGQRSNSCLSSAKGR